VSSHEVVFLDEMVMMDSSWDQTQMFIAIPGNNQEL
jgi:hypothetical protein